MRSEAPGPAVADLLQFIDRSPTPYHAVREGSERLKAKGFQQIAEQDRWELPPGARRFVVRGGGSLIAFVVGNEPPATAGFWILGAHTDSPNFRIKPSPDIKTRGLRQLAVETYGSVLLHTWLDRDLSIAGRVTGADGLTRLLRIDRPVCRMSNLAIHLNPALATNGLQLNPQQHLTPALGLVTEPPTHLLELLSEELGRTGDALAPEALLGFDLCLYDTQPAAVGGSANEFLFAPRLDNLASCHAALAALMATDAPTAATRVVVLYDHEEVGSQSAIGARSQFLVACLERLARMNEHDRDAVARAIARSLLVSIDMAHAVHPGYPDKHDPNHMPKLGNGPVIKVNANQSYATDGPATALFEAACRKCEIQSQRFVSRNDMRCGSTIGPISAAQTGIRTIDVGNPMLSMHSCREMASTLDVEPMIRVLTHLLTEATVPPPSD